MWRKPVYFIGEILYTLLYRLQDGLFNKGDMNLSEWGGVVFVAAKKQSLELSIYVQS